MKESYIQNKIVKYLEGLGWYVRKIIVANKNGTPDIICCTTKGMFVSFEVKGPNGRLSKLQEYNKNEIVKIGGKAYCVNSLEVVKEIIKCDFR